ncbi:MAG: LysR family transcriptional regulator [Labilithrix sp.]|nr:LysR family transcriptional regulator [Labilithrix sp.]
MLVIVNMHDVHLSGVDLNLLVALRALLAERHVTRAAARIGLTQPAMSHALARLRELLGDPILVRTPQGMQPTPRAEAIAAPLERALEDVERIVAPPEPFRPERATRRFRIATGDYVELVFFPAFLSRLWAAAPQIDVRVSNLTARPAADLAEGRVDLSIGVLPGYGTPPPRGIRSLRIIEERFVCVVRHDHPIVKKRLTLDEFVALPHALVAPRGEAGSIVDTALARLGKRRRVAIEIPHFLVAPHIVRETDVVLTLAARVAKTLAPALGLRQLAPPIEIAPFTMAMVWHDRQHAEPAHVWLRALAADVAKKI